MIENLIKHKDNIDHDTYQETQKPKTNILYKRKEIKRGEAMPSE